MGSTTSELGPYAAQTVHPRWVTRRTARSGEASDATTLEGAKEGHTSTTTRPEGPMRRPGRLRSRSMAPGSTARCQACHAHHAAGVDSPDEAPFICRGGVGMRVRWGNLFTFTCPLTLTNVSLMLLSVLTKDDGGWGSKF